MKYRVSMAAYLVALIIMNGCQRPDPPDAILAQCLHDLALGNVAQAYEYFSYDDQLTVTQEEFVRQYSLSAQELCIAGLLRDHVEYHVGTFAVGDDTAAAPLTVLTPSIMEARFKILFFDGCSTSTVDSFMNEQGSPEWIPVIRISDTVLLRREGSGWRIFGYWQRIRKQEAEASAKRLNYIQTQIEIQDIRAFAFKDERTSYLTARVVNKGDETLEQVEIMVVCFNQHDRPCYSVTVYPVSPSSPPLGPRKERPFRVELPHVPADWNGNLTVKVVNTAFVQ